VREGGGGGEQQAQISETGRISQKAYKIFAMCKNFPEPMSLLEIEQKFMLTMQEIQSERFQISKCF
jgi:hypothetical protein